MKRIILSLLLGALGGLLKAEAAPPVLLDGLSVPAAQVQLTPKAG